MKQYTKIAILFVIPFLISCANVKLVYGKKKEIDINDKFTKNLIKAIKLENNESIVIFRETFRDIYVKIISDKQVLYEEKIETAEVLGLAGSFNVKNDNNVYIIFNNKKKIVLRAKDLKLYKFIYIGKRDKKYTITYTNVAKLLQ